jgi:hypothetical protein
MLLSYTVRNLLQRHAWFLQDEKECIFVGVPIVTIELNLQDGRVSPNRSRPSSPEEPDPHHQQQVNHHSQFTSLNPKPGNVLYLYLRQSHQVNLLRRMLRLDSVMVNEEYKILKERKITDELISLNALTQEQLDFVHRWERESENTKESER